MFLIGFLIKDNLIQNINEFIYQKKKIILTITQDMKIYECFVDNLKFL